MTLRKYYIRNQIYEVKYGIKHYLTIKARPRLFGNLIYYHCNISFNQFCRWLFTNTSRRNYMLHILPPGDYDKMLLNYNQSYGILNGYKFTMKKCIRDDDCEFNTIKMQSIYDKPGTISMHKRRLI
jgi:hypothetical protein